MILQTGEAITFYLPVDASTANDYQTLDGDVDLLIYHSYITC